MHHVLVLGSALIVAGCVAHARVDLADLGDYDRVRVTLADGERFEVLEPRFEADTIRGMVGHGGRPVGEFAAPLAKVSSIEASEPSPRNTRLLILGIVAGAALLLFAAYLSIVNDPNY